MTDAPASAPADGAPADGAPADGQEAPTIESLQAKIEELTGHSRKWEDRAKANAAAAKELEELKTANLTDEEKRTKALADLEKRLADAETARSAAEQAATRLRIAAEHGLSSEDAELLTGDEDAMKRLAARIAATAPTAPKTNPAQGKSGVVAPESPKEAAKAVLGGLFR